MKNGAYNKSSVRFIVLQAIMQPNKLLVFPNHRHFMFGKLRKCSFCMDSVFNLAYKNVIKLLKELNTFSFSESASDISTASAYSVHNDTSGKIWNFGIIKHKE